MKLLNLIYQRNFLVLLKNFTFLSVNSGLSFVLQLLLIPYLTRQLGLVNFGMVAFGQVVCLYLGVVVDYGFAYSGTRQVSINRHSKRKLSHIFSSILNAKILLGIIVTGLTAVLFFFVPKFNTHYSFFILCFPIVFGQMLIPLWFFQGMEQMKYITVFNSISKILSAIVIFLVIHQKSDFIYVNFIQGTFSMVIGLISVMYSFRRFNLRYYGFNYRMIIVQLKEGSSIFVSNLASNICVSSSLLILGFVGKPESVGLYSVVDKVYTILRTIISSLFTVVYPRACSLALESQQRLKIFLRNYFLLSFTGMIALSLSIIIFSNEITFFLTGEANETIAFLMRMMAMAPVVAMIGSPLGIFLLSNNHQNQYAVIVIICSLLNIVSNLILVSQFDALGSVLSLIITEAVIVLFYYFFARKYHRFNA